MSTYLVAFVIGSFDFIEGKTVNGTKCRVYTEIGKSEQAKFALALCTRMLPFFEEYFNFSYPLPKMDMVAIRDSIAGKYLRSIYVCI